MKYIEWLNIWFNNYIKPSAKERTYIRYEQLMRTHIAPKIGDKDINDLTPIVLQSFVTGEVAANSLGDLSPFSPPCLDFHFTPSLCRLYFRSSRERLCFLLRRYCGSIPSSKTAECCKTIFVLPWTSFQCSVCRLLLSCIAFS